MMMIMVNSQSSHYLVSYQNEKICTVILPRYAYGKQKYILMKKQRNIMSKAK